MKKLVKPNVRIDFSPSPRQLELWNVLQPNFCDVCRGTLEMREIGKDERGHSIREAVCTKCGNTNIPEQILSGGAAGGGKSFLGCCWLISSCMRFEGIRMVVARKTLKVLKSSTWRTLLDVLHSWGLKEDLNYHIDNQQGIMTFWNGSTITMMELSPSLQDPDFNNLGSLEITGAFVDEVSEVSEKAIEVLASRIRYKIAETFVVGKILMSTNPCTTWVRSVFVQDDDGNPVTLPKGYRFVKFTIWDNPNDSFRYVYIRKLQAIRDKATRERLYFGNWDFTDTNRMAAYWNFDGEKKLVQNLFEQHYDQTRPIILSVDFNVNPYMTCLAIQIDWEKKKFYILKEYIGKSDDKLNNTPAFSRFIAKDLKKLGHIGGVNVTGDPAGLARSTQTEEGVNNFTIFSDNMFGLNAKVQLLSKQPSQTARLEFVNELLVGFDDWEVLIDLRCRRLTDDLVYQMKNPDGTKEKKKFLMDNGTKAERYGHASDCLDYAACYYLAKAYEKYKSKQEVIVTTVDSSYDVYNEFAY